MPKEKLLKNAIVILDAPLSSDLFPFTVTFITGRNEVVAKVIFLQVSASVHAGMPYPPRMQKHPPRDQGEPPPDQADPPREEHCSIRSMSGRYASYWNVFLLVILFLRYKKYLLRSNVWLLI